MRFYFKTFNKVFIWKKEIENVCLFNLYLTLTPAFFKKSVKNVPLPQNYSL